MAKSPHKLFRAIVVMGAALGTSSCGKDSPRPPDAGTDAKVADAAVDAQFRDAPSDGVESDAVVIL